MPPDRAPIRSALPNFVNFMRFLHPGQACAAKFDRSAAELGWDGSLMHCKSQGLFVPSANRPSVKTMDFPRLRQPRHSFFSSLKRPVSIRLAIDNAVEI